MRCSASAVVVERTGGDTPVGRSADNQRFAITDLRHATTIGQTRHPT